MTKEYEKLQKILKEIRKETDFIPDIALVLGSGLGAFANKIKVVKEIKYSDLSGFPISTVSGHEGKFLFGYIGDIKVVCMQGRVHFYEGYKVQEVVMPIRIMKMLGAKILILTNAAGGINNTFKVGDFMQITDHISTFVPSPLIGENIAELEPRFADMSEVYNKGLTQKIKEVAQRDNIELKEGTYLQTTGPNYETPHEIMMYEKLGADAVGMSTAIEAMVANSMGMKVAGISLITNLAAGKGSKLSHEEVKDIANKQAKVFEKLIFDSIIEIGQNL